MLQRVVHGKERGRNGRGCGVADAFGQRGHGVLAGDQAVAEAGRAETDHALAGGQVGDVAADGHDFPGELQAQGGASKAVFDGFIGEQPEGVHDIAEVQAGGLDAHFHLVGTQLGELAWPPL